MKQKSTSILVILLIAIMAFSGCGGGSSGSSSGAGNANAASEPSGTSDATEATEPSGEPSVLKYAHVFNDMDGLDVHRYTTNDVIQPAMTICEPLVRLDEAGNPFPLLLEALPEMSQNGTLFTCKLKEGVLFHDGTELTSEDVLFTFARIFDPVEPSINYWLVDMIKGAKEYMNGEADQLTGITIIDPYNFTIELEEPFAPFISSLACEQNAIYPKAACEAAGDMWGVTSFVGTGPFKMTEFASKEYLHVERNNDYHGELAKLDELYIYNMEQQTGLLEWEAGNIDVVWMESAPAAQYIGSEFEENLLRIDLMGIKTLNLNTIMAPLDNQTVRQAMKYAIDQKGLVNSFLQGLANPTMSQVPPGIIAHSDRESFYNPERAKELLAEAGYPDGIDLETYVDEKDEASNVLTVLQEQLKASNINLKVNRVDRATYIDMRRAGEVQCPVLTWYKDISDPDNFLYTFYFSDNSKIFSSNWNDPKTDELLLAGRSADPADREAIYEEVEEYLVVEQSVMVPLYNPSHFYLIADGVEGIFFDNSLLRFDAASKK